MLPKMFAPVRGLAIVVCLASAVLATAQAPLKTKHVFLITTDGLRWQEVFNGAEESLLTKENGGVADTNATRTLYWRDTPEERRQALMPFLWSEVAKRGQLFGNQAKGSIARVTNPRNFSYPGYNEFLTGAADPRIDSNAKKLNVNTNVFEWLQQKPRFRNRVAAVCNWDTLSWIMNTPRNGIPMWTGFELAPGSKALPCPPAIEKFTRDTTRVFTESVMDTSIHQMALAHLRSARPRAFYVAYAETDEWAHDGRYDRYLNSAHHFDRFVRELWETVQSMREYRGQTTFIIATDHGRGPSPVAWKSHGMAIAESAFIWVAILGPDTPPLGERHDIPLVTQSQIAATVAAAVGEDYRAAFPQAAPPIRAD